MMDWDLMERIKHEFRDGKGVHGEAREALSDAEMDKRERYEAICVSHLIGKCLWCSKCELWPLDIEKGYRECQKFAEAYGCKSIFELIIKERTEEKE